MSEIKYKRVMLKVSGEALAGPAHRGLDFNVINSVCAAIKECLDMGVQGAALATILSQAASCTWILCFLTGKKTILRLRRENLMIRWKLVLPCLALGLSPFVMQSTAQQFQ